MKSKNIFYEKLNEILRNPRSIVVYYGFRYANKFF